MDQNSIRKDALWSVSQDHVPFSLMGIAVSGACPSVRCNTLLMPLNRKGKVVRDWHTS